MACGGCSRTIEAFATIQTIGIMSSPSSIRQIPLQRRLSLWAGTAALAAFLGLATAVARGATQRWDEQILLHIHQSFLGALQDEFVILTAFGGALFVALSACVWAAVLLKRRRLSQAYFVIISVGGAAIITMWLKLVFERSRPELWSWGVNETSFSFPSAHALASSALALTVFILARQTRWRWRVITAGILYVLLVSLSRLALGVHYPSDIIGGWLVGIAWVCLSWLITTYTWPAVERRSRQWHTR